MSFRASFPEPKQLIQKKKKIRKLRFGSKPREAIFHRVCAARSRLLFAIHCFVRMQLKTHYRKLQQGKRKKKNISSICDERKKISNNFYKSRWVLPSIMESFHSSIASFQLRQFSTVLLCQLYTCSDLSIIVFLKNFSTMHKWKVDRTFRKRKPKEECLKLCIVLLYL